ncbi:hypothetical protein [Chryseolinea lacunae]|uniref:Uncharacterized protein n=1 Tax=Chryseolinea lacunae TaxID=2801331 RepID=A0ABS1KQB5_9BACT|nr:hypothetical protein [Chryseolinea lacunae]MBL0741654.1 hypothetical protein [Chryseolinea lacunae]
MKVNFTALFLSTLFLWGSLCAYGQCVSPGKTSVVKAVKENITTVLASIDDADEVKVSHFEEAVPLVAMRFAHTAGTISNNSFSPAIYKPIRAYIVFRALRT